MAKKSSFMGKKLSFKGKYRVSLKTHKKKACMTSWQGLCTVGYYIALCSLIELFTKYLATCHNCARASSLFYELWQVQEGGIPQCHRNALSYLQKLFLVNRGLCQEVTRESFMFLAPSGMPNSYYKCKGQHFSYLLLRWLRKLLLLTWTQTRMRLRRLCREAGEAHLYNRNQGVRGSYKGGTYGATPDVLMYL